MNARGRNGGDNPGNRGGESSFRMAPVARAVALILAAGSGAVYAAQPFSPGWYASKSAIQGTVATTGLLPDGKPVSSLNPSMQQQQANAQLQKSIANLTLAAHGIAAQQAALAAARQAALGNPSGVPDGLAAGGLDAGSLASSWINASAPTQTATADGKTQIDIQQTADRAIANWETFNVGKNTIVQFDQASADWAILNRVLDPMARPSQIQGQIKAPGTVLIVNRNGIVFSGTSQINTRNLVAAAADIDASQFVVNGIYGPDQNTASFTNAQGALIVEAGAQIATSKPESVTQGGGYVLLLGRQASNAGEISTPQGQTELAAGDTFYIRKGVDTLNNTFSTTRGNEISPKINTGSDAGRVVNSGLITAAEGDITLAGREVRQDGVAVSTTTVNARGTIHLLSSMSDDKSSVALGSSAITGILLGDGGATALDSQRDALISDSAREDNKRLNAALGQFDNLSQQSDRRDLSRVEIVSGGDVNFDSNSMTLATGGQISVNAAGNSKVASGAQLDVSGAVGVNVSMASNSIKVNVQGNELRDAPVNRDSGNLASIDVFVDRGALVYVPAGTDGYDHDRWYTAGGLLEVSGYLGNQSHSIGEWAAQGGVVTLQAQSVTTAAGSAVNLSGGSLNVQTGRMQQSWLVGADGNLYNVNTAPADLLYSGLYRGFEVSHPRWGKEASVFYYNPFIGPQSVLRNGYTVGRDGGQLRVIAPTQSLAGDITAEIYNGPRQFNVRPDEAIDGYKLGQFQVALQGGLSLLSYDPHPPVNIISNPQPSDVLFGGAAPAGTDAGGVIWVDASAFNRAGLGGLAVTTIGDVQINEALALAAGGVLNLSADNIGINADVSVHGGSVTASASALLTLGTGHMIDTRGLWTNALLDGADISALAYINGGAVRLSGARIVVERDALIDASAGGAVRQDGARVSSTGGAGGDITLVTQGELTLEGNLVSYGFTRGGKLSLETPAPVSFNGDLLHSNGTLAAGESAPMDLVLSDPTLFPAGSVLPFSLSLTITAIMGGQTSPPNATFLVDSSHPAIVGPAGWQVPANISVFTIDSNQNFTFQPTGTILPPGAMVGSISGRLDPTYVLPVGAFANGLPIAPQTVSYAAGVALPSDVVAPAGTIIPHGSRLAQPVSVLSIVNLAPSFFEQGFSAYQINSHTSMAVQPDTVIDVRMPVYRFKPGVNPALLSGDQLAAAVEVWQPPLFQEDAANGKLLQRAGADLTLLSGASADSPAVAGGGNIQIGEGVSVSVDPGRSVRLASGGQITIDGTIRAPGGDITIMIDRTASPVPGGTSIWLGEHALLDTSGIAYTALDGSGRRYGIATDGGTVQVGLDGLPDPNSNGVHAAAAWLVMRPGARIDASGAAAQFDLNAGSGIVPVTVTVAGDGGSIALGSNQGMFIDEPLNGLPALRANAGAAGASGGSLAIVLENVVYYQDASTVPTNAANGRVLTIGQDYQASALTAGLQPGVLDPAMQLGQSRVAAQQIQGGGFDNISLSGRDAIAFDGDVSLSAGRSITLNQGMLTQTRQGANVTISAPYVLLDGHTLFGDKLGQFNPYVPSMLPVFPRGGVLTVDADLIDVRNLVTTAFDDTRLHSGGDLRFLAGTVPASSSTNALVSTLDGAGDLDLTVAQIYPVSGAAAQIIAGRGVAGSGDDEARITIASGGGPVPAQPYSLFGQMTLNADVIDQGGVLRAPMGSISLNATREVDLRDASVTSVSTRGLLIPYGGTTDGVTYTVDGKAVTEPDVVGGEYNFGNGVFGQIGVNVNSVSLISDAGSVIDVSGGGKLAGAAFINGRGGSVDTLLHPRTPGGKVYAIVPGNAGSYAPVAGGYASLWSGDVPDLGRQITIPAGVPGLPAGTYTLMPANYALLPGAYRVELGAATSLAVTGSPDRALHLPDGSWLTGGIQSVANTGIHDVLQTPVTITSGDVLRTYSQYNEQSYDGFETARAKTFGTPRTMLEIDGKRLSFSPQPTADADANSALIFNGWADFSAGDGGYAGAFALLGSGAGFAITGPGSTTANSASLTTIAGEQINRVAAPVLFIGSQPTVNASLGTSNVIFQTQLPNLVLESGAILRGAEVALSASDSIVLKPGAQINTLAGTAPLIDSSLGLIFGAPASGDPATALLMVSNGLALMNTPAGFGSSHIEIDQGAALYSQGTLGFYSDAGLVLDGVPQFGTRNMTLAVPAFNIGSSAALAAAGTLPAGMRLDQDILNGLLNGNPVAGAPALERLILGATKSVNFFGPVELNTIDPGTGKSRLGELVINSPAIYGYGGAGDTVRLVTDTLVWNGLAVATGVNPDDFHIVLYDSATPGAVMAGGTGSGRFEVDAARVVFGYPTQSQPNTALTFDRLMLGFADVAFNASDRISSNAHGTLSAYLNGTDPTAGFAPDTYAGTGGALHLNTPLLTGDAAATMGFYTGGTLTVAPPAGGLASATVSAALGAQIDLHGDTIAVSSAIVLPSGKLTMTAQHDVLLADGARLDLSGQTLPFFDVTKYSWGGDLVLESTNGDILQQQGAVIDLSAAHNDAGTLQAIAIGASGRVRLEGTLRGTGGQGFADGAIDLRAQRLGDNAATLSADFAALNQALNTGDFFDARSFDIRQGDLAVGNEVKAHKIEITTDGGSLTVNGRIDASGDAPGTIRLSARDDLRLGSSGVLDAHGSVLQVDSFGQPIEADNRASVELNSTQGWLRLDGGTTIDLSSPDGMARGRIEANARRVDENGGDVRIDASAPVTIRGAGSIAVNAFWTYAPGDADGTIVQDNTVAGTPAGAIGMAQIDAQNTLFINNASGNGALQTRLAGLSAYGNVWHLRPGVEIVSGAAGKLTVAGDIDLSGYRYGPDANRDPASAGYGAGEPLSLAIRSAGDLTINGSINDGFAPPKDTPDDVGFTNRPKVFDTILTPGFVAAMDINLTSNVTLDEAWTVPNDEFYSDWGVDTDIDFYGPGDTIPAGATISIRFQPFMWVAGVTVPATRVTLQRPQGKLWAVAPMLNPGMMSASIRLASGADLTAADPRALSGLSVLAGSGNMTMDDPHSSMSSQNEIFSVIRTGTGNLDLLSGGNITEKSSYGIYTAGTQSDLADGNALFDTSRPLRAGVNQGIFGSSNTGYETALNDRLSYFPDHGGDFFLQTQGNLTGHMSLALDTGSVDNYSVNNWLWRQGGDELGRYPAWSVNFGTFVLTGNFSFPVSVAGFTGMGALGGGNVTLRVGGDAGNLTPVHQNFSTDVISSTGLQVAVGATGRVTSLDGRADAGVLTQTGGGNIDIRVGGRINPAIDGGAQPDDLNGVLADLRGNIRVQAGSIGNISLTYGQAEPNDPRAVDLFAATTYTSASGGLVVAPGDGAVSMRTRGDLVFAGVADPTMVTPILASRQDSFNFAGVMPDDPGVTGSMRTWFSLWTGATAIDLFAGGGNLTPVQIERSVNTAWSGASGTFILTPDFSAVAGSGSIYYGSQFGQSIFELAPSSTGQLEILARGSIYAAAAGQNGEAIRFAMSGADPASVPTRFDPAFILMPISQNSPDLTTMLGTNTLEQLVPSPFTGQFVPSPTVGFFAFGKDTVTANLHAGDRDPMHIYAVDGDIVNFLFGEEYSVNFSNVNEVRDIAAKAAQVRAGRDIVSFGNPGDAASAGVLPGLIMNANEDDISSVVAGRDIFYANLQIAGPGLLQISAGRNLYQADKGPLTSSGPLVTGDQRPGADILLQAGVGANGPDFAAMLKYLDPAMLLPADGTPLAGSGKVARTYEAELASWLGERYGFSGDADAARAYFNTLAPAQQQIFLRQVFFDELRAGGREYNDPQSSRFGSYLRGRDVIATLFPQVSPEGGDITMFGASGVRTLFGGNIGVMAPAGQVIIGVQSETSPPPTSGLVTQGAGDIDIFSDRSLLLGLSRIMTTFGGDILAWSATGDINAGRGSKTTVIFTPPKRAYDDIGNVVLAPQVPSSGAGIATLNPIPEVPPGDVDLIAPLGTIDAGEAGIRVSGNVNLAALQVANAANIQVQGKSTGLPLAATVNVNALTNAGAAATQATMAAQDVVSRQRAAARQALPSIFTVRVLGFGNEVPAGGAASTTVPSGLQSSTGYDAGSRVQIAGHGQDMKPEILSRLTDDERRKLSQDR